MIIPDVNLHADTRLDETLNPKDEVVIVDRVRVCVCVRRPTGGSVLCARTSSSALRARSGPVLYGLGVACLCCLHCQCRKHVHAHVPVCVRVGARVCVDAQGVLLCGIMNSRTLGKNANGLIHILMNDVGPDQARSFIDQVRPCAPPPPFQPFSSCPFLCTAGTPLHYLSRACTSGVFRAFLCQALRFPRLHSCTPPPPPACMCAPSLPPTPPHNRFSEW
jgi:hypothetical protein